MAQRRNVSRGIRRVVILTSVALVAVVADAGEQTSAAVAGQGQAPGTIVAVAGRPFAGPATQLPLDASKCVTDRSGYLYTSTRNTVVRVDPTGSARTFAGTGIEDIFGDGDPAITAGGAMRIAGSGPDGSIYLSEYASLRKISPSGIITTVAGNGTFGFSGDGGPATAAMISGWNGVAADDAGNLYLSDANRIRRIDTAGTISTIAGGPTAGHTGDGGPATAATLDNPGSMAFDRSGNLLIAESSAIRKITPGGIISTIAVPAPATPGANDLAVDSAGRVLIAQSGVVWSLSGGTVSRVAGTGTEGYAGDGGPAASAQLGRNLGLAPAPDGRLYICDADNHRVRIVGSTGQINTWAGTGGTSLLNEGGLATGTLLLAPVGLAVAQNGDIYVFDSGLLRRINASGTIETLAGGGSGYAYAGDVGAVFPARSVALGSQRGDISTVGIAPDGGVIFSSGTAVFKYSNGFITKVKTLNLVRSLFPGLAVGPAGQIAMSSSSSSPYGGTSSGVTGAGGPSGFSGDGGPAAQAQLDHPRGLAYDHAGGLLIADTRNNRIRRIDPNGIITTIAGNGLYDRDGALRGEGGPATAAALEYPSDVTVGPDGTIYFTESYGARIRRIDPRGIITTIAGNGGYASTGDGGPATSASFIYPTAIAADPYGGVLVLDRAAGTIRRILPTPPPAAPAPAKPAVTAAQWAAFVAFVQAIRWMQFIAFVKLLFAKGICRYVKKKGKTTTVCRK